MRTLKRPHHLILILCFLIPLGSLPVTEAQQRRRAAAPSTSKKPRLVVGIVIDQFRADYLTRFEDQYGEGGFKRLMKEGANFVNANYIHTPTYTACGHATFMTGASPAYSGIIGNEWYERETGKRVTSVIDEKVKLLGGTAGATGMSPDRMTASTIGDQLKMDSQGKAKVVGVSLKDRSAILPAGHRPDGAYWYDARSGNLVSSTYYFNDLPEWVKRFNKEQRPDRFFNKQWDRLLPIAAYDRSTPDEMAYEKNSAGNKFPYKITGNEESPGPGFYNQFQYTPFANDYLVDFAKAAIEAEQMGADDVTDLLTISFSSNDLVGHQYGPYSHEVQDMALRTDRTLAELFSYLEKRVGLDRVIVALTADHGVAPVPENVQQFGFGGRVEPKLFQDAIQSALSQRFGEEKWILYYVNGNVYLDEAIVERKKLSINEVERVASLAALKIKGVGECYTRSQILSGQMPKTTIAQSVVNGYYAARNGNLVLLPIPYWFLSEGSTTTHGTPYHYDTHVPVIFYGAGVAAGTQYGVSSPADIAPTIAALLKIEPPSNVVGRILTEAIKQ
jgi:predicted AlkP superfamily pyrophosphatase or phosphodiesterase